jgi:hypothetical protein
VKPIHYLDPVEAVQAIDRATDRHKGRRKREPVGSWTVEPTPTSLRREKAQKSRRERLGRPAAGGGSPRPVPGQRELTERGLDQVRSQSVARIVRPHRYPWQPPELDLADLPCACTADAACHLHAHELGGRRPYAS